MDIDIKYTYLSSISFPSNRICSSRMRTDKNRITNLYTFNNNLTYQIIGHPSATTPAAVGQEANEQPSGLLPHQSKLTPSISKLTYNNTPINANPASNAPDNT